VLDAGCVNPLSGTHQVTRHRPVSELDIFLVGCIKENIYATEAQDYDNLISCILVAATDIRGQPRQLIHARNYI
jgi:hypothetical protein